MIRTLALTLPAFLYFAACEQPPDRGEPDMLAPVAQVSAAAFLAARCPALNADELRTLRVSAVKRLMDAGETAPDTPRLLAELDTVAIERGCSVLTGRQSQRY